jgi:ABC-2 type transport system permease protein
MSAPSVPAAGAPFDSAHGFPGGSAPVSWWALNLRAMWARAYVRLVSAVREPMWLLTDGVLPALAMAAYVMLYRALGAPPHYESIAVLGGLMSIYWLNVLWSMGAQLYWEKQQGQLALYFAAPCERMAILSGMAVGGIAMTTPRAIVTLAIGFGVLGARVEPFNPWMLLLVFVVTMSALYSLGMILASLFLLHGREAWHYCTALQEPVYFLSGLYFPLRSLGSLGAIAVGIFPLALGVDALRQVMLGPLALGLFPVWNEIAALGAMSVVLFFVARFSMAHLERLAKREGKLTQRWQ